MVSGSSRSPFRLRPFSYNLTLTFDFDEDSVFMFSTKKLPFVFLFSIGHDVYVLTSSV